MARSTYVVLMLLLFLTPAAASDWKPTGPPPLTSQVVDAETGQPIEGAVVLAHWTKCYPSFGGWAGCEFSDAEETVTGPDGRYVIKRRFTYEIPLIIQVTGPALVIFKPGYGHWVRRPSGDAEIMALPLLKTRAERWKALVGGTWSWSHLVRPEYTRRMDDALCAERVYLGLK